MYWIWNLLLAVIITGLIAAAAYLLARWFWGSEHLTEPKFLWNMAMQYSDPTYFNYFGRSERDVSGNSMEDYYLENQMNASTHVGPQYFEGDAKFHDQTNYMDMPIYNRPLRDPSPSAMRALSEIHSNNMEERAYQNLNALGSY